MSCTNIYFFIEHNNNTEKSAAAVNILYSCLYKNQGVVESVAHFNALKLKSLNDENLTVELFFYKVD